MKETKRRELVGWGVWLLTWEVFQLLWEQQCSQVYGIFSEDAQGQNYSQNNQTLCACFTVLAFVLKEQKQR